ncbi:hypothetical protein [Tianweitania sp.]|uniref:hypothetical protein n=1 Tax=Tianweitania sp. TaxID=2021634 RepID=UPI00289F1A14|nr:hypothetical protein [Tianweitania sp.]
MSLGFSILAMLLVVLLALAFFGITPPAIRPGHAIMAAFNERLSRRRGDHSWIYTYAKDETSLINGESARAFS